MRFYTVISLEIEAENIDQADLIQQLAAGALERIPGVTSAISEEHPEPQIVKGQQ